MIDLNGRYAVVTGGASGIGRATVLRLAAAGARVWSGDLDGDGNRQTAAAAPDGLVTPLDLDVASRDSIAGFARRMAGSGGDRIDLLVNVAGWDRIQPFLDATPDFMDRVLDINLAGPINVTRCFLPAMVEANAGKIVNVASDAGRVGSMGETIYSGAKGGVIAFTKSLARETARHRINVNCVCPGPTNTPLLMAQPESMREKLARAVPFRRVGEPGEVADAIVFLLLVDVRLHYRAGPQCERRADDGGLTRRVHRGRTGTMRFENRGVIVTGGAGGIGRETAIHFAREGAAVTVADREGEQAREVAAFIAGEGGRARGVPLDVTDAPATEAVVAEAAREMGSLGRDLLQRRDQGDHPAAGPGDRGMAFGDRCQRHRCLHLGPGLRPALHHRRPARRDRDDRVNARRGGVDVAMCLRHVEARGGRDDQGAGARPRAA